MAEGSAGPSGADMKKKPMLDQVCEAIRVLAKPRKGASAIAIKRFILDGFEESEHSRILNQIKKALAKGEEAGLLGRPTYCKDCVGVTGSFLLKPEKVMNNVPKHLENKPNRKKLFKPEEPKVVKKPVKPKTTKAKNSKKEENENEDSNPSEEFTHSTPKKSDPEVEQKGTKPRVPKKPAKSSKKVESSVTIKKHASDSDLTSVKGTEKPKKLKETTTKKNKPEKPATSKEKASNVKNTVNRKTRTVLKSYNSDSVLL